MQPDSELPNGTGVEAVNVNYRYYRIERAVVLAFAAPVIALATMVACGGGVVLREPVFSMALLLAVVAIAVAYPFLLVLLLPTRLDRSLPVVCAATVGSTWLFSWLQCGGLILGSLVSLLSMVACRRWFRDEGPAAGGMAAAGEFASRSPRKPRAARIEA